MSKQLDIESIICSFIETTNLEDIYNEFSLQHELGIYLREKCKEYKIQFERNVSFFENKGNFKDWIKHEIDIVIYDKDLSEKYAIELKYPRNGQYPEQMYKFIEDICFMEEVKEHLEFTKTFVLTMVDDKNFYQGKDGYIYSCFRGNEEIHNQYNHPTGKHKDTYIVVKGKYKINWKDINDTCKYYMLNVK